MDVEVFTLVDGNNRDPSIVGSTMFDEPSEYPVIKYKGLMTLIVPWDNKIMGFNKDGSFVIAGNDKKGNKNGSGDEAEFNIVRSIKIKNKNTLIFVDSGNHQIKGVDLNENGKHYVYTYAGSGQKGDKDGPALDASFWLPTNIAIKRDGTVIVADRYNHKIKGISPDGIVYTIAGAEIDNENDDLPLENSFKYPYDVAVREDGLIIVADYRNNQIKGIDLDGNIFTIAGTGEKGDMDGIGSEAMFDRPCDVSVRDDGTIVVYDLGNSKIKGIKIKNPIKSAIDF